MNNHSAPRQPSERGLWITDRYLENADLAPCGRCGKDVVLDHDPPCPEGYVACPECGHETVCADCRLQAEADMHASGDYDPKADPFHDHTAPPPLDRIERDGGYHWDGGFVQVPTKETP